MRHAPTSSAPGLPVIGFFPGSRSATIISLFRATPRPAAPSTVASSCGPPTNSLSGGSMQVTKHIHPQSGDLILMVGTVKGAFIFFQSARDRRDFTATGPFIQGYEAFSMAYLPDRDKPRIVVGNKSQHWGSVVSWTDDFGATWNEPAEGNIKFPSATGQSLNAIWALEPAPLAGPDVVYAGVDPASLWRSD